MNDNEEEVETPEGINFRLRFSEKGLIGFPPGFTTSTHPNMLISLNPAFRSLFANIVSVSYTHRSEFSIFFADLFPFGPIPKSKELQIKPSIRIIYPSSEIEALKDLCEKAVKGHRTKVEIPEFLRKADRKEPDELRVTTVTEYGIPFCYANAAILFYDTLADAFRIVFGEKYDSGFSIETFSENSEIKDNVSEVFVADLAVIVPVPLLSRLSGVIEKRFSAYKEEFGISSFKTEE
ncbi:MAG: hypothetical protein ACE5OZ_06170 [Candidatus Heimdallarchaeota archaeon]